MTKKEQVILQQMQNTLSLISVRGADTIYMARVLETISSLLQAPFEEDSVVEG